MKLECITANSLLSRATSKRIAKFYLNHDFAICKTGFKTIADISYTTSQATLVFQYSVEFLVLRRIGARD
jgi:hypothetical protein